MRGGALDLAIFGWTRADRAAGFDRILALHERRVYLTALRLTGNSADAQDAAQEVFLRLHRYGDRFDESRDYAPWLYRVTVNVCRDMLRRRRRTAPLAAAEPAVDPDAPDSAERAEQQRLVREALRRLPEQERAVVVLRDIEGMDTREVARILGIRETTVRSHASKARVKIKDWLKRRL